MDVVVAKASAAIDHLTRAMAERAKVLATDPMALGKARKGKALAERAMARKASRSTLLSRSTMHTRRLVALSTSATSRWTSFKPLH